MKLNIAFLIHITAGLLASLSSCGGSSTADYLNGNFISGVNDSTPPSIINPQNHEQIWHCRTTLQWSSKYKAAYYTVDVSETDDFSSPITGSPFTVNAPATSLALTLPDAKTYYWRVCADSTPSNVYGISSFESMDDAVYVYMPASASAPDNTGMVGNKSKPFQTIRHAVDIADELGISKVKIASRGTDSGGTVAVYGEVVSVKDGVSLYGGYKGAANGAPDFSETSRSITANPTKVQGNYWCTLSSTGTLYSPTAVEGLYILGSNVPYTDSTLGITNTAAAAAILSNNGVKLTIKNCSILSADVMMTGNVTTYGVYTHDAKVSVENCEIQAGKGDRSRGVGLFATSVNSVQDSFVRNNIIHGADGCTSSIGLEVFGGNLLVANNRIFGQTSNDSGLSIAAGSCGVYLRSGKMEFFNNIMAGYTCGCVGASEACITAVFTDNTIVADGTIGNTTNTAGIYLSGSTTSSCILTNNIVISYQKGYGIYKASGVWTSIHTYTYFFGVAGASDSNGWFTIGEGDKITTEKVISDANMNVRDYHVLNANTVSIDMGTGTASSLGLGSYTNRADGVPDTGIVDLGYHYAPCGIQ